MDGGARTSSSCSTRSGRPRRRSSFLAGETDARRSSARPSPTSACGCCSTRVVDLAPAAGAPARRRRASPAPLDAPFSGFVFKVQANMDPSHRDRIAFLRVCSGRFERGMVVTHGRTGKPFATKYAHSGVRPGARDGRGGVPRRRRRPGQRHRRAGRRHALRSTSRSTFPAIPSFAPEHFSVARVRDTGQVQAVPQGHRPARRGGRGAGAARPRPRRPGAGARRRRPDAVRGRRRTGSRTSSAPRSSCSPTVVPRGPPHRRGERATALRAMRGVDVLDRADGTLLALFESTLLARPPRWPSSPSSPSSRLVAGERQRGVDGRPVGQAQRECRPRAARGRPGRRSPRRRCTACLGRRRCGRRPRR